MSIIEKLFFGEINISNESTPKYDEELERRLDEAMEQFNDGLSEKQKRDLDNLVTLLLSSTVDDMVYVFKRGFEMGFLFSEELNESKDKVERIGRE